MSTISDVIQSTSHRPWPLPAGNWEYYQEWNRALFLHWKVPESELRKSVPESLTLDTIDGHCYISLVAFEMEQIRPRGLPAVGLISNFGEINIRTYVSHGNKKGVYFLNIEAEKYLSTLVAKTLSGLPYEKAAIQFDDNHYQSRNDKKNFELDAKFTIGNQVTEKTALDTWLTERYCLYLDIQHNLYSYEIHHKEWVVNNVDIHALKTQYRINSIDLAQQAPDATHYSPGVPVISWGRKLIT